MVGMEMNYISPLRLLLNNLQFTFDMKYRFLSLCDLLAPILYTAMIALGGAIPGSNSKTMAIPFPD
jgi:hypothetical protein